MKRLCISVLILLLFIFALSVSDLTTASSGTLYYKVTQEVYFDITIGDEEIGRITIGLFGDDAPLTVQNFVHIVTKGINGRTYMGTKFHRVIPRFVIQGGDIVNNDGTGSVSIYGEYFPSESFNINHTAPGFVSMANFGKDTNGCQFFITTMQTPSLDGKYVVFGKVVDGQNLVHKIEHTKRNYYNERPIKDVVIKTCGQLPVKRTYYVVSHPYTFGAYFKAIVPPLFFSLAILGTFQWIMNRLDTGCRW